MTTVLRTARLSAAESFWYLVGCIGFGLMYLAKVPVKKALAEAGLAQMTGAERFWYRVQCVALGAGYLAKIPVKKALTEIGPVHGGGRMSTDRRRRRRPAAAGLAVRGSPPAGFRACVGARTPRAAPGRRQVARVPGSAPMGSGCGTAYPDR